MGDDVDGGPVLAVTSWASNAELIRDCARLGYLRPDDLVVDVTFGLGTWWRIYKPEHFLGYDLDPTKAPDGKSTDFRSLPHPAGSVDVVAFDPHAVLDLADLLIGTDLTAELGAIRAPALLLAPDQSPFVPLAVMEDMHARIPGSELQVFAGARHGLPCSHGEECGRALRAFLDRLA